MRIKDRRERQAELMRQGVPAEQAATELGLSVSQFYRECQTILASVPARQVDALREIAYQRCEALIRAHLPRAQEGNVRSGELVLGAMRETARLYGLDAPVTASLTATVDVADLRTRIDAALSLPAQVVMFNPDDYRVSSREPAELLAAVEVG